MSAVAKVKMSQVIWKEREIESGDGVAVLHNYVMYCSCLNWSENMAACPMWTMAGFFFPCLRFRPFYVTKLYAEQCAWSHYRSVHFSRQHHTVVIKTGKKQLIAVLCCERTSYTRVTITYFACMRSTTVQQRLCDLNGGKTASHSLA